MEKGNFKINKGINQSIEFKGLKAQYIWYLGGGVVALLMIFSAMYLIGIPSLVTVPLILFAGTGLVVKVYQLSHKYGEYGLMKALARKRVPKTVCVRSRQVFMQSKNLKDYGSKY